ncbi:MAG: SDR family NAD(P)-dependent oxidoreductase, partial [Anaerolineaceae bacterium]|nr:SDR family NAD(P)-dependent oxidoreductase [Anaerolineaceae bacterium]
MTNIFDKFRLDGQVALVTGGAGLLGKEFCRTLAQAGASVVVADLNESAAAEAAQPLQVDGAMIMPVGVDVTNPDSVNDMVEQTLYNHLLGAQSPDGRGWAYYMGLRDSKRFRWHTDPDCCPTRGVRALAQMVQHVFSTTRDGIAV